MDVIGDGTFSIDTTAHDAFERNALEIPAPGKSLNSTSSMGTSVCGFSVYYVLQSGLNIRPLMYRACAKFKSRTVKHGCASSLRLSLMMACLIALPLRF